MTEESLKIENKDEEKQLKKELESINLAEQKLKTNMGGKIEQLEKQISAILDLEKQNKPKETVDLEKEKEEEKTKLNEELKAKEDLIKQKEAEIAEVQAVAEKAEKQKKLNNLLVKISEFEKVMAERGKERAKIEERLKQIEKQIEIEEQNILKEKETKKEEPKESMFDVDFERIQENTGITSRAFGNAVLQSLGLIEKTDTKTWALWSEKFSSEEFKASNLYKENEQRINELLKKSWDIDNIDKVDGVELIPTFHKEKGGVQVGIKYQGSNILLTNLEIKLDKKTHDLGLKMAKAGLEFDKVVKNRKEAETKSVEEKFVTETKENQTKEANKSEEKEEPVAEQKTGTGEQSGLENKEKGIKSYSVEFIKAKILPLLKNIKQIDEVKNLDIKGSGKEITLNTMIKSLGFNITVQATLENKGEGIAVKNYKVDAMWPARGQAKKALEPHLNKIPELLKSYIEKEEGRKIDKIWIESGQLKFQ